jgi:hypothetical protein
MHFCCILVEFRPRNDSVTRYKNPCCEGRLSETRNTCVWCNSLEGTEVKQDLCGSTWEMVSSSTLPRCTYSAFWWVASRLMQCLCDDEIIYFTLRVGRSLLKAAEHQISAKCTNRHPLHIFESRAQLLILIDIFILSTPELVNICCFHFWNILTVDQCNQQVTVRIFFYAFNFNVSTNLLCHYLFSTVISSSWYIQWVMMSPSCSIWMDMHWK